MAKPPFSEIASLRGAVTKLGRLPGSEQDDILPDIERHIRLGQKGEFSEKRRTRQFVETGRRNPTTQQFERLITSRPDFHTRGYSDRRSSGPKHAYSDESMANIKGTGYEGGEGKREYVPSTHQGRYRGQPQERPRRLLVSLKNNGASKNAGEPEGPDPIIEVRKLERPEQIVQKIAESINANPKAFRVERSNETFTIKFMEFSDLSVEQMSRLVGIKSTRFGPEKVPSGFRWEKSYPDGSELIKCGITGPEIAVDTLFPSSWSYISGAKGGLRWQGATGLLCPPIWRYMNTTKGSLSA